MPFVSFKRFCLLSTSASTFNLRANGVPTPSVYLLMVESAFVLFDIGWRRLQYYVRIAIIDIIATLFFPEVCVLPLPPKKTFF